jgi:threonine dehydratase
VHAIPTLLEILDAHRLIRRYLPRTPLYPCPGLSELLEAEVYVKYENHQPIGAFKVRGGVNLIARLSEEERRRGVITASTGNHGQSIAWAARLFGVRARVVVPVGSNPDKVTAIERLGAEILVHGQDFDQAREYAEALAEREGHRYIHSANEPHLIAGVGTIGLEIVEDLPDVEAIFVPVGGGSGASGISIVARALNPQIEVIGVQSEAAPAAYLSWRQGRIVATDFMRTFAEGLATRVGFELPLTILRQNLADFILVSEDELRRAMLLMMEATHNLVEAAGAAPLAAALRLKDRMRGRKIALVLSGGNVSLSTLRQLLAG